MEMDDLADGDWSDFGEKTEKQLEFERIADAAFTIKSAADAFADKIYARMVRLALQYNKRASN